MHPDEAALLKAVCAAPDDDLPRLVYADWLDEHNEQSRAEFIRTQIELAKLTRDSKRRRKLAFRCRELMVTDGLRLCDPPTLPERSLFSRGFAEVSEIEGQDLTSELAAEFSVAPFRRLWVTGFSEVQHLAAIPTNNHLLSLDLMGSGFEAGDLLRLSRMKRFPHLTEIGLMCCELDDDAARVMCDRPFFQNLKTLRVGGNPFTDAGRQLLRDHFGGRVSFTCERDPEYLYSFRHDERFTVGVGHDSTQLFLLAGRKRGSVAVFDHTGGLIRFDKQKGTSGDPAVLERKWLAEYGGEAATIRVKRFQFPNGVGIGDFARGWIEELENPNSEEREIALEWLGGWLDDGKFCWNWDEDDDWWLNREGEVTDT